VGSRLLVSQTNFYDSALKADATTAANSLKTLASNVKNKPLTFGTCAHAKDVAAHETLRKIIA
jgi:hypothetical protein